MGGNDVGDNLVDLVKGGGDAGDLGKPDLHGARLVGLLHPGGHPAAGDGVVDGLRGKAVAADAQQGGQGLPHGLGCGSGRAAAQQTGNAFQSPVLGGGQIGLPLQLVQHALHPVQSQALGLQLTAQIAALYIVDPQGAQQLPEILGVAHTIASTVRVPRVGSWSGSTAWSAAGERMV